MLCHLINRGINSYLLCALTAGKAERVLSRKITGRWDDVGNKAWGNRSCVWFVCEGAISMPIQLPQQFFSARKSEWAAFWTRVLMQRSQEKCWQQSPSFCLGLWHKVDVVGSVFRREYTNNPLTENSSTKMLVIKGRTQTTTYWSKKAWGLA